MTDRHRIRGLIFDFDGLILDTEVPAFESWREIYEEHGGVLTLDIWAHALGGSGREVDHIGNLERSAGHALDGPAIHRRRLERKVAMIEAQEILPGVLDYIAGGKELGLALAVVSSSSHSWVDGYLRRLGIADDFEAVVCGDDAARSKPYPDLYNIALDALHIDPRDAIAFEDSPNGVTAAQAAGLFCVAVPNAISAQLPLNHADLRVASLADMPLDDLIARAENTRE